MDILQQLGGLVLGAVPTMVFFLLLVALYGVLVRKPLEKTLAERKARTSGAMEQAKEAISAAEAEAAAYEEKLRAARADVMAERAKLQQQWNEQREKALAEARATASEKVNASRKQIEDSVLVARKQIEGATEMLSEQILRAILPATAGGAEARQ